MRFARTWRLGLALAAVLLADGPFAIADTHKTGPETATEPSPSCNNIGPLSYECKDCEKTFTVETLDPGSVGYADCKQRTTASPFGVELAMSQGFSAVIDSGSGGLGAIPGGCSSCGAGGMIPASSQMLRFQLARYWRSTWTHDGSLGRGMYTGYDYYVVQTGTTIEIRDPNTDFIERFVNSGGGYVPAPGIQYRSQVTEATTTHITIRQPGGVNLRFEITGYVQAGALTRCRLEYVQDRYGNKVTFSYALPATNTTANVLKWSSAVDPYGRTTTFTYTIFNGLNVLSLVTFADGRTVKYIYTSDNSQFPHTIEYGTGGVASGIESTWYVGATVKLNEALLPADHYFWQATLSGAAFGRVRGIQRTDSNYVFATSVTSSGGVTTATLWKQNVVEQIVRSRTKQLISSRKQLLDGSWETDIPYSTGGDYLPTTDYTEPAVTGVPARTTSVVRDASSDMVTQRTYADSAVEHYAYNSFNQMTSFTDRLSHVQTWLYDTNATLLKHTVAVGTALETHEDWTYNATGQVLTYSDFNTNVTTYEYYPAGDPMQYELKKINLPSGPGQPAGSIVFTYDAFGRVLTAADPVTRTSTFAYDAAGRWIKTTYDDTSTDQRIYGTGANSARILETRDRNDNRTVYTYDGTGRITQTQVIDAVTSAVLTTTTKTFDPTTGLLTRTDTDGDYTDYAYDYLNRVIATTVHPSATLALTTQNVYDRYRLNKSIDYYGRATSYTRDNLDRPLSAAMELIAGGATITTHTGYNAQGLTTSTTDGNGNLTTYSYDARNRRTTTTVAFGSPVQASSTLSYDNNSNVTDRLDERGHHWPSTYTVRNQLLTSADPLSDTTGYTYTADTLVATVTNANGHTTTNTYEPCCARLEKVTDQDGNFKQFDYDFNGNRTKTTDESLRVVTYAFDGLNRQIKMTVDPAGLALATTTTYDVTPGVIGQSSTTTSPATQAITTKLDGIGRTILVTGDTAETSYEYDIVIVGGADNGLVKTTVHRDPSGINLTTANLTDGAGRTIKTLDGFTNATAFTYDANSNQLTATDRDGKVTTNTFDERNRMKTSQGDTGGIAATTSFVYGPTSNLLRVTDAQGKVTKYTYDDANRRLTTTYAFGTADANTWTTTYKPLGQIATLSKPNGVVITYSYENRELLSQQVYTQGITMLGTDTVTYHPNHLLKLAHGGLYNTDIDRSVLNTSYDTANRLVQEQENIGAGLKTLSYQYTPDSLQSQGTYPGGTVAARTYNAHRLLYQTKLAGITQATFSYDTADRRQQRDYVNGVRTNWTLDANDRVTDLKHATTGMMPTTLQEWNYRYTAADDPLVQDDVTPTFTAFGEAYQNDGLHQLTNYKRGTVVMNTVPTPTSFQTWVLSQVGDWTSWNNNGATDTRTHNNLHALTARSAVPNPQLYDANFNQTDDGQNFLFVYDANDKLQTVKNRATSAVIAQYRYDVFGRRIEKNVGGALSRYYLAGQQILEERDGADSVTAFYTYGTYVDEALTMDRGGSRYYFHANRFYSTYLLTDNIGIVAERYAYTAYGVPTSYDATYTIPQTTSRLGNSRMFTGRELDDESILYNYNARTYDATQGRYKQLDPIGFAGGINLYEYVGDSPLQYMDSSGLAGPGMHHGYPLHLGGSMSQPVWDFTDTDIGAVAHNAAQNFFTEHGFGPGDAGRAAWARLSEAEQSQLIAQSLRGAGVSNELIAANINDVMAGATPGIRVTRAGAYGRVIGGAIITAALMVILDANTAYAAEANWRQFTRQEMQVQMRGFPGCCYCGVLVELSIDFLFRRISGDARYPNEDICMG